MRSQTSYTISILFPLLALSLSLVKADTSGAVGTIQLREDIDAVRGEGVTFNSAGSMGPEVREKSILFRTSANGDLIDANGELTEPQFRVYYRNGKEHVTLALGKLEIDQLQEKAIAFAFSNGDAFAHPCKGQHGVRVTCDAKQYVCDDSGITDYSFKPTVY